MDFDSQTTQFFTSLLEILAKKPSEKAPEKARENLKYTFSHTRSEKEMPEELQSLIQEYSKPLTRGDWRTCKRDESRAIYLLWRDKRHVVADFIGGPEFWDIVVGQTFYELLKNYPAGPPSDEGQTTIQLRRVWV